MMFYLFTYLLVLLENKAKQIKIVCVSVCECVRARV